MARFPPPKAQEISAAIQRFRAKGKFVIAQATAFFSAGLGDYVAASAADEIWMQPKSTFRRPAPAAARFSCAARWKRSGRSRRSPSAPNTKAPPTCSWKSRCPADREQLTALMSSVYDSAVTVMAANCRLGRAAGDRGAGIQPAILRKRRVRTGLIDRIGYDDEAKRRRRGRAGAGVKTVKFMTYVREASNTFGDANIAIVRRARRNP